MNFVKFLLITLTLVATTTSITLDAAKKREKDEKEHQHTKMRRTGSAPDDLSGFDSKHLQSTMNLVAETKEEKTEVKDPEEKTEIKGLDEEEKTEENKTLISITSRDEKGEAPRIIKLPLAYFNQFGFFKAAAQPDKETPLDTAKGVAQIIKLSKSALPVFERMLTFIESKAMPESHPFLLRKTVLQLARELNGYALSNDDLYDIIILALKLDATTLLTACLIHPQQALQERLPDVLQSFITDECNLHSLPLARFKEHCFSSVDECIIYFTIPRPDFNFAEDFIPLPGATRSATLLNERDEKGNSLLHQAENASYANMLIRLGHPINIRNHEGKMPLDVATGEVAELLRANHNLLEASRDGNLKNVEKALNAEAFVDVQDHEGFAPLIVAAQNGHKHIVKLLLDNKAHVDIIHKEWGSTPLMFAAQSGHRHIVELLLAYGASKKPIVNNLGWTALDYAQHGRHKDIIALLNSSSLSSSSSKNWCSIS